MILIMYLYPLIQARRDQKKTVLKIKRYRYLNAKRNSQFELIKFLYDQAADVPHMSQSKNANSLLGGRGRISPAKDLEEENLAKSIQVNTFVFKNSHS